MAVKFCFLTPNQLYFEKKLISLFSYVLLYILSYVLSYVWQLYFPEGNLLKRKDIKTISYIYVVV